MNASPGSKEAVILKLLEEGDTMLCLDARAQGVLVPPQHASNPALRLIFNLNFRQPIEVTAEAVSANLSFGGRRFACYIPMTAVWAAFNPSTTQGMMWPDSMPPEVVEDLAKQQQAEKQQARSASQAAVEQPQDAEQQPTETGAAAPPPPRQKGHLRVIK